jgi:hypothetical protein
MAHIRFATCPKQTVLVFLKQGFTYAIDMPLSVYIPQKAMDL